MAKLMLRDLVAIEEKVELSPGKFVSVQPLTLQQIIKLVLTYKDAAIALYNEATKDKPNYPLLLAAVPDLVAEVICMGTNTVGQEAFAARIAPGTQLQLIAAIWELSVPDAKKLIESLSRLMGQAQRLGEAVRQPVQLTREDSTSPQSSVSTST